jgi:ubiquinone/menaquinone biosynthesis C-methylase UbiE
MDHDDHVFLLRRGVAATKGTWADFGSGRGAFTLALAELLGLEGEIISVDRDKRALESQQKIVNKRFPLLEPCFIQGNFSQPLTIPPLNGLVIANALHFFRDKSEVVCQLASYLVPGGRFIVVEYNTDRGNRWVPYPFSYKSWLTIASNNGLKNTHILETVPSSFLGEIFSAVSFK